VSSEYTTTCSACGSLLCTRDDDCPTCSTCGKRGHLSCGSNEPRLVDREAIGGGWFVATRKNCVIDVWPENFTPSNWNLARAACFRFAARLTERLDPRHPACAISVDGKSCVHIEAESEADMPRLLTLVREAANQ